MLSIISLFIFTILVSARPLVLPASTPVVADDRTTQSSLSSFPNSTSKLHALNDLYLGNQKFRNTARIQAEKLADERMCVREIGLPLLISSN
jgi:hypothetical protein